MTLEKETSHLLAGDAANGKIQTSSTKDPESKGRDDSDEIENVKDDGCCRKRRVRLMEPCFMLVEFALWSMVPLSEQFVYNRLSIEANLTANEALTASTASALFSPGASNGTTGLLAAAAAPLMVEQIEIAIKTRTSQWVLYLNLGMAIPSVFTTLLLCAYGDIGGRRPVFIIPCIGGGIKAAVYVLVAWFNLPLGYLAIGHVLEGLGGGQTTVIGNAYAYIADVVPVEARTLRYTFTNTCLLIAGAAANFLTGVFIRYLGYLGTCLIALAAFGLGLLYLVFVMAESRENDRQRRFSFIEVATTTLGSLKLYGRPREGHRVRTRLALLLVTMMVNTLLISGLIEVAILYLLGHPFYFNSIMIGEFLAMFTLCCGFAPLLVLGVLARRCAVPDAVLGMVAGVSGITGFTLLALARNNVEVFMMPILVCLFDAGTPASRAAMSKIVDEKEQGALQASISCTNVFNNMVGVTYHAALYTATVSFLPGLIFLVSATLCAISFILYALLHCLRSGDKGVRLLGDSPGGATSGAVNDTIHY